jgi:hypothetical protein
MENESFTRARSDHPEAVARPDIRGIKLWEMRSTKTSVRGRIALIEAGSGLISGETLLIDCREALTRETAEIFKHMHQVEDLSLLEKWKFPWVLMNARKYLNPIKYKHPRGAVIWVDLTKAGITI